MRTAIQTGVSDGEWIEVTNRRVKVQPEAAVQTISLSTHDKALQEPPPTALGDDAAWVPFDGSEQVIVGDLAGLTDGTPVQVAPTANPSELACDMPGAAGGRL